MDSIATLLPKVLRKRGIKDEADASFIVFAAAQWLKERDAELARTVIPTQCAAGILILEARSSVAAQECMGLSEELLRDLRKKFPGTPMERVRILRETRAGNIDPPATLP